MQCANALLPALSKTWRQASDRLTPADNDTCNQDRSASPHGIHRQVRAALKGMREANIADLCEVAVREENVGSFDIEVDDVVRVQIHQALRHVQRDALSPAAQSHCRIIERTEGDGVVSQHEA